MLRTARQFYFRNLNIGDSKLFRKTVKRLTKDSTSIPVLNYEGRNAFSSKDKADVLSTFFKKCFNSLVQPLLFADLDILGCCTDKCPDDFLCTVDEVQHLIETLDIAKSTGSDGIAAKMLKSVAQSIAPSVTELMNLSIQSGCFPVTWKLSNSQIW